MTQLLPEKDMSSPQDSACLVVVVQEVNGRLEIALHARAVLPHLNL